MSSGGGSEQPLLAVIDRQGETSSEEERWWEKAVNMAEAKRQLLLALPMVFTNVFYCLIPMASVMFAGHLGETQLSGSTLANSWATVTGFAFMIGLSGALETLCGQGFGAQLYSMLGVYLQASCIISFLFSIIISVIWWYTEPILILLHQSPDISKEAAVYMRYLIPGIFAYGTLQNVLRFLQTQSVVIPLMISSLLPLLVHFGLNYILVHCTSLGYVGAPMATSITFWLALVMLVIYINKAKKFEHTWTGLSKDSFQFVFVNLKLALPSAAMVCLEYWAFEILVLLAGLAPNSKTTTSVIAMCVNTENVAYNFTYGLSAAASTRVSNELGAGKVSGAKHAMCVSLKLSIFLAALVLLVLGLGHDTWASFFSGSPDIIKAFASMTPLLCASIFLDSIQGILSGSLSSTLASFVCYMFIADLMSFKLGFDSIFGGITGVSRGCGWQHLATYINFGTFYLIGMPIASLLAFKLHLYSKGLWFGLICGLTAQSSSLFVVTRLKEWKSLEFSPSLKQNSHPL